MDRSHAHVVAPHRAITLFMALAALAASTGCASMLATGMYVLQGGNVVPAECEGLKGERVVVMCKPPSSHEYRHAGASRAIAARTSEMLAKNVKKIDVVNPREVDNWIDESDWGDFRELAQAVHADKVVYIEIENFELYKGKTLYQGNANMHLTVYDMKQRGKELWSKNIGEVLYPTNSGIPAQDKPVQQFEREFVEIIADRVATNFFKHDPNESFALDAMANR